jgi:hypothetical protein
MAGFGLRIARSMGMEGFTGNTFEYPIDAANANTIFHGDPVILNAGALEEPSGNTPGPITAGPIVGSFAGCRYVDADGSYEFKRHWDGGAGRSEIWGAVSMPPHARFLVRGVAGTDYQPDDVGGRFLLNYVAGNAKYGDSRVVLGAADAAGPVQLQGLAKLPGNNWGSDEPILEVSVVLQANSAADVA